MTETAVAYFAAPSGADGPSVAAQQAAFLRWCAEQRVVPGETFTERLDEDGARAGFRELLDHLRGRGDAATVVVSRVETLGREMREAVRSYFQITGLGARVVALSGGADTVAELVQGWQGREERERLGERVRDAMRRKAVKGEALGRPPYGYRVGPRRRLEPVPDEAALVRYIYRLYTQDGLGIRLISRRLNEEGYRTRRDGNWSMVTIRDILRNRAYLGTYTRFGVRVPGSHPALIAPEEFRKAQDRMVARRTGGGPRSVQPYLLAGLAYCGYCGNRMIGVTRRQSWQRRGDGSTSSAEYRYYQCGSRTNQSMCDYHTHTAADLDDEVRLAAAVALAKLTQGEEAVGANANLLDEPKRLQTRLRQLDRRLEQYLDLAASGRLAGERFRTLSTQLGQQQTEVEGLLAETNRRGRERAARTERHAVRLRQIDELGDGWAALTFDTRRQLLRDVLDRVIVRDEGSEVVLRE